jgi:predicted Rossmann fold nucleotide-binding protein DprA/Smf involved in DNA uptake
MTLTLSPNTQAILLLTAPLVSARGQEATEVLTLGEYKKLAKFLRDQQRQPFDFLAPNASELVAACEPILDSSRLNRLLARGLLLSEAVERWQSRAIWVMSRADAVYPARFKSRLKDDSPPILYGCGDASILDSGGLAIVGSRDIDEGLLDYTRQVAALAARSTQTVISGGARGVDQAAMRGALEEGGKVAGVLADSLERAAMHRDHRDPLMARRLALVSPYDPSAGFNVGHAMQRNKLIYALADAALIVNSDYEKGGTWAGAVEQLERLRFGPVYVRANGSTGKGLEALRQKGASAWPDPISAEEFVRALSNGTPLTADQQQRLDL